LANLLDRTPHQRQERLEGRDLAEHVHLVQAPHRVRRDHHHRPHSADAGVVPRLREPVRSDAGGYTRDREGVGHIRDRWLQAERCVPAPLVFRAADTGEDIEAGLGQRQRGRTRRLRCKPR
jgi:hypothetical protein